MALGLVAMKAPILLVLAGLSVATAQSAEPSGTLTLACQGTTQWSGEAKPETTSIGIILDFAAGTLEGFGSDVRFPIRITDVTETTIAFNGNNWNDPKKMHSLSISGTIDRVTGAVEATLAGAMAKKTWSASYVLKCKPTQRMF
jgi:hypothetical protein